MPADGVAIAPASLRGRSLFGHPPGLAVLFLTQMWAEFSYFGLQALLVYYMTERLGFSQAKSSLIYGSYGAAAFFSPFFGGIISDRWLGRTRSVVLGGRADDVRPLRHGRPLAPVPRPGPGGARQRAVHPAAGRAGGRPLRRRRRAQGPRLQRLLHGHQPRRLPGAAGVRLAGRAGRLALGVRRRRRRHVRRPVRLPRVPPRAAARPPTAQDRRQGRACFPHAAAEGEPQAAGRRDRHRGAVPRRLRAERQRHRAVGRPPDEPRRRSVRRAVPDPGDLVPGDQLLADHRPDAGADRLVGTPRAAPRRGQPVQPHELRFAAWRPWPWC